jgi:hypothetical protein
VDEGPLLLAMNARDPGTGAPNQMLISARDDTETAAVVGRLARPPFGDLTVRSRPAIQQQEGNNAFSIGLVWGLTIGALAGIALSIIGVVTAAATELRDDAGELWELEEHGIGPRSLIRMIVLRTLLLCGAGAAVGTLFGMGLGWLAALGVSLTAQDESPVPPLDVVAPWGLILLSDAAILLAIVLLVFGLLHRHFHQPLGSETRR